ncbi:MAG: LPS export ABC transporter periplasmic protein LptC [Crocinitomicaceae bacterium]|nr:LPS export ABC transporter periplasmic protein LptC [Crocinitomicaceae bacterium]
MKKQFDCIFKLIIFFSLISLTSCVNDLDTIRKITYKSSDPDDRTRDLVVLYTDSGYAKVQVFATIAETYSKPEQVMKLKDGVKVNFFSNDGEIVSVLTALYGEIHQNDGTMFVRDSVVLFNKEKNQRLETEELHWNQKDSSIYTNKAVIVRKDNAILFGQGIKTKQDFSEYEFVQPRGSMNINK